MSPAERTSADPPTGGLERLSVAPDSAAPGAVVFHRPALWCTTHPLPLGQLNVARPVGDPPSWDADVATVAAAHHTASRWSLRRPSEALTEALVAHGYARVGEFEVLVGLPEAGPPAEPGAAADWAGIWFAVRGQRAPAAAWDALGSLTWTEAGGAAALLANRVRGEGLLWGAAVLPGARGRGVWGRLLAARRAAAALGLRRLYAVVGSSAVHAALVRRGFRPDGDRVEVWERPWSPP